MARYSEPPPILETAIESAAAQYQIPDGVNILTGIWRIESGSTYPNPYVNSIGYGGLFGTKDWNGPPGEQANLAASILARLYRQYGNMSEALYHYSGGGYSSVPGEGRVRSNPVHTGASSQGNTPGGGDGAGGSSSHGLTTVGPDGQPLQGSFARNGGGKSGGGFWGFITQDPTKLPGEWLDGAEGLVQGPLDFMKAALWLLSPITWLRAVEAVFGLTLILVGIGFMLGADRALKAAPGPVGMAANAAGGE